MWSIPFYYFCLLIVIANRWSHNISILFQLHNGGMMKSKTTTTQSLYLTGQQVWWLTRFSKSKVFHFSNFNNNFNGNRTLGWLSISTICPQLWPNKLLQKAGIELPKESIFLDWTASVTFLLFLLIIFIIISFFTLVTCLLFALILFILCLQVTLPSWYGLEL